MEEPDVRLAGRQEANALLKLISEVQPDIPWTAEHIHWQFFDNPAGEALLYTIQDGGRPVSLYVAIPQRIRVSGTVHRAYMVQDVMTRPEYRGRGYLNYLGRQCTERIQREGAVGYTFPNKLSENSFRRSHWTELMRVPFRRVGLDAVSSEVEDAPVTAVSSFPESIADVWVSSGLLVGVERDKIFLDWRYGKPETTYLRFLLGEDDGFLVLKLYESEGARILHICDLVVRADKRVLVSQALGFVAKFAKDCRAVTITCWLPENHPYAKDVELFGLELVRGHDRFNFVLAPKPLAMSVSDPSNWHLSQGDSDVY